MKYLIQTQPGHSRALVFGLTWHTTLGNDPDVVAARLARRENAVAYTRGGVRSTVVGLLRARRSALPRPPLKLYAAAAVFARAFARGPVALTMRVPSGTWLVAAIDGTVVPGTDTIFAAPAQAHAQLDALRARYRGLTVYDDDGGPHQLPANALSSQWDTSTRLILTRKTYARLPVAAWLGLIALLGWAIADHGVSMYQAAQRARQESSHSGASAIDPVARWHSAIEDWARRTPDHGGQVLSTILDEMATVPLAAERWALSEIDCLPVARRCSARYRRERLGTSRGLRASLPAGWTLHWPDLHTAVAQWTAAHRPSARTLQPQALLTETELAVAWTSHLQRLTPGLADATLGEPAIVSIDAPLETRADGTQTPIALTRAPDIRLPRARTLIVNGPMRTLYMLNMPTGTTIERVQVRRTPDTGAALARSALTATLTGKIHAK